MNKANFERGDLDLSLWLISSTELLILDKLDYSLHFFHVDTIVSFNKRIHDKWMTKSIAIIVIQFQEVDDCFELIVADGDSLKDVQTVCI